MILERGKIYKCIYMFCYGYVRNYIIICPSEDVEFDDARIGKIADCEFHKVCSVNCIFYINFNGNIRSCDYTNIYSDCRFEELNSNDILDIKRVFDSGILNGFKYNRKLNKLVEN